MKRIIRYVVATADRGLLLKPNAVLNEGKRFLFNMEGMSDSDYAKYDYKESVSGWFDFMNGATASFRRKLIPIIALSVT